MATYTCQTDRWVSTSPYVKLTVVTTDSGQSTKVSYSLQYISDYGVASATAPKGYSVSIGGKVVKSGTCYINGKSSFTVCEGEETYAKTKATQTLACSCSFNFMLTWSGSYCTGKSASVNATISPKTSYAITYNANGGSGTPGAQTKWHGESITLSSTKPTRTGYTFQGWGTSASDTSVDYQSGASYTANAALNLYAIWKVNTYTVTYNANGGSGAPANQTKTYGKILTLSTSKPTRTNYTFKGWATSSTGAVSYQPGGGYSQNAAITLYAVWELSYVLPKIYNTKAEWVADQGDSISIEFDWETTNSNPTANLVFNDASGSTVHTVSLGQLSGKSGQFERTISASNGLSIDTSYTIKITLSDGGGDTTSTVTLTGNAYPIDFLAGGRGVAFGGAASLEDTVHFQWAVRFDKPVHGMVRGLGKLPKIEPGSDFNAETYRNFGAWAVYGNADSLEINNMPPLYLYSDPTGATANRWVGRAGILEVFSPTGEGMRSAEWSYIRQRFIPYSLSFPVMERDITRNASNVWSYGGWYKTSLSVKDEPVTLYSGNAQGAITLSQAASNFEYLEIFFTDNNGEKGGYTKIHYPYTGVIDLSIIEAAGNNTYIRRTSYTISGTTMTPDTENAGFARLNDTAVTHTKGTNYIKITRVVGRNS